MEVLVPWYDIDADGDQCIHNNSSENVLSKNW